MSHKLSDYKSVGDSVSMACLGDKPFTVVKIERNDYDDKKGVVITTKESFKGSDLLITDKKKQNMTDEDIAEFKKGTFNKFHTTRYAVTNVLINERLMDDVNKGESIYLRQKLVTAPKKGGNQYWELVDA